MDALFAFSLCLAILGAIAGAFAGSVIGKKVVAYTRNDALSGIVFWTGAIVGMWIGAFVAISIKGLPS